MITPNRSPPQPDRMLELARRFLPDLQNHPYPVATAPPQQIIDDFCAELLRIAEGIARRLIGDRLGHLGPEDFAQEAVWTIVYAVGRGTMAFAFRGQLINCLKTICSRRVVRARRHLYRFGTQPLTDDTPFVEDGFWNKAAAADEWRIWRQRILRECTRAEREYFLLWEQDLSNPEIAARLGIPLPAVQQRAFCLRKRFAAIVNQYQDHPPT